MKEAKELTMIIIAFVILLIMSMFMNFVQRQEIIKLNNRLYNNQIEYKRVLGLWNNCEKESIELVKKNYDCSTREMARYIKFFEKLYKLDKERREKRYLINYKIIKGGK